MAITELGRPAANPRGCPPTAEEVLLEKRLFVLNSEQYDALMHLLDYPRPPTGALRKLLLRKAPWENDANRPHGL